MKTVFALFLCVTCLAVTTCGSQRSDNSESEKSGNYQIAERGTSERTREIYRSDGQRRYRIAHAAGKAVRFYGKASGYDYVRYEC